MKSAAKIRTASRFLLPFLAAGAHLALALPQQAFAAGVELATVPMATSTTTTVKPNLMFVLDDSGSMDWDYIPSESSAFASDSPLKYGFHEAHCNGNYYNPTITYSPPVIPSGATFVPLNATATSFTAAYKNGYKTSDGTVNLDSGFKGGSGTGDSAVSQSSGPAYYYTYTGTQTAESQKTYSSTSSVFYKECNSTFGTTTAHDGTNPVNNLFTLTRLSSTRSTTITVAGATGGSTLKFRVTGVNGSTDTRVSEIELSDGTTDIFPTGNPTSTSGTVTRAVLASRIAGRINECTASGGNGCDNSGYSASVGSGADADLVTVSWNAGGSNPGGGPTAGTVLTITADQGVTGFTYSHAAGDGGQSWTLSTNTTTVTSIMVGATNILPTNASGTTANALASDIQSKISATGYSATVAGAVVTVTGPAAATSFTPVMTTSGTAPLLTLTALQFPDTDAAKLQNFANWYSYYSNRMLMMKTGAGLAFQNVSDAYRVGYIAMNNANNPAIVEIDTFNAAQRTLWYTKLYAATTSSGTPLKRILSRVGQYFAHKFGDVTNYHANIVVSGSGATSVDNITVGGVSIMSDQSVAAATTAQVALNIASRINSMEVTNFGASVTGSTITVSGIAPNLGVTPVIIGKTGSMAITPAAFTSSVESATLNGISPADPIQYSCQQNFTILSTDGYWNNDENFNLDGNAVGNVDAGQPRPITDGGTLVDVVTTYYTRTDQSETRDAISGLGTDRCDSGKARITITPQTRSCDVPGSCTAEVNGTKVYKTPYTDAKTTCVADGGISVQSPDPSNWVVDATKPAVTTVAGGTTGGTASTLADVALYYYQTDLRTPALGNCTGALGNSVCENNVFTSAKDNNLQQHMTTFTLGLGVKGKMTYSPSYLTDITGDFVAVKQGDTATASVCTWQTAGTVCNWPAPVSGQNSTVDDLWHAAVNGRGAYFSAQDPEGLALGLNNVLTSISSKQGAAAAAATSTLNPVAGNNYAYVASYTTLTWTGNLEARGINTETGVVSENATWCIENVAASACAAPSTVVADSNGDVTAYFCETTGAVVCAGGDLVGTTCRVPVATACTGTMNALVGTSTDTRSIKTANAAGTALIDFDAAYATANPTYFDTAKLSAAGSGLSQWPAAADASAEAVSFRANAPGLKLLNYLRGQRANEIGRSSGDGLVEFFRNRESVLGDALESQPAYIGAPIFSYPYPGYAQYLLPYHVSTNPTGQGTRSGTVYMGTNDGMMHAFHADTGVERWAYVPSMVIPNMYKLADSNYKDKHTNYVNGSPITTDICTANCANEYVAPPAAGSANNPVWKTILVAGLNGGGRGYFALDITVPTAPALLWEFTTTSGIGTVTDNDLGYTFGQPVVTRKADGTWVVLVTSGYDNGTDSPTRVSGSFVAQTPAGDGKGYLYVLNAGTGAIISKISTGVGTAATPSGLAKIAGYNAESGGNKVSYVYGGDLQGNLWRFDINAATAAAIGTGSAMKFATLFSEAAASNPQPIMTTPILGTVLGKRVVFVGTGKYLEVSDLTTTLAQSQYAIKDDDATATLVNPRTSLVQQFLINNPDGTATRLSAATSSSTTTGSNTVNFGTGRGWFLDFPDSRERVNIDAKLVLGTLVVPTIVPSSTECSPGGSGWLNFFDYLTGGPVNATPGISGVKYDSTIVGVNVLFIEGNPIVEVVTSTDPTPTKDENVQFKATSAGFAGKRVMWRELIPQD